uniref:hypothetical protein n=1 Tax=Alistipes sp. TaxID=1872444 RepID=UPI00405798B7
MGEITIDDLRQVVAEVVREELSNLATKIDRKDKEELGFDEALAYLKKRRCVNSKSKLYKLTERDIPYVTVGRRRVYKMADLRHYAERKLKTA